jgi:deoxyribose-phosphate aldolase
MDQESSVQAGADRPPPATYDELARILDFVVLRPELNDEQVEAACRDALAGGSRGVLARPSDADLVVRLLSGTTAVAGSVVAHPFGWANTSVKLYELRDLLRRGIRNVVLTLDPARLVSRQFQAVELEVLQAARACHEEDARLTVSLGPLRLPEDLTIIAVKIAKRSQADAVQASWGAPKEQIALMNRIARGVIPVYAAGVRSLDEALELWAAGCGRLGAEPAGRILEDWQARLAAERRAAESA